VGDARAEVVDGVQADVAREPLEYFGQLIVGASLQRCFGEIPFGMVAPIGIFKLMLHIKQPDAERSCKDSNWRLDQQVVLESNKQRHHDSKRQNCEVGIDEATSAFLRSC